MLLLPAIHLLLMLFMMLVIDPTALTVTTKDYLIYRKWNVLMDVLLEMQILIMHIIKK